MFVVSVPSESEELDSSLDMEFSWDEQENTQAYLHITHFLDDVHQLQIDLGRNEAGEQDEGFDTESWSVGLEELSDSVINTGFTLERWGNTDVLSSESIRGLLRINGQEHSLSLIPQLRRIRIEELLVKVALLRELDFNSRGMRVLYNYMHQSGWYLDVDATRQRYISTAPLFQDLLDDTECRSDLPLFTLRVSPATSSLSQTLEDRQYGIVLGKMENSLDLGVSWYTTRSAITGCENIQRTLQVGIEINRNWSISGQVGDSRLEGDETVLFASGSVTVLW